MATRVLILLAATCAAVHAIGISPKVDLPGVVKPRRALGTDVLDPEKVQAVLQVKVKSARPDSTDTKVNAVVCLNSDVSKCGKREEQGIRPSIDVEGSDEEEEGEEEDQSKTDNRRNMDEGGEEEVEDEDEEQELKNIKTRPIIVIVEDEVVLDEKKKSKKKKVQDVPVIVGYKGVTAEEEEEFHNDVHIVPSGSSYSPEHAIEDVPVYTGLKLRPEFDRTEQTYAYLNPPQKSEIPVTFKEVPFGFDESALVAHIFETSPLIKALQSKYNPSIQHSGSVAAIAPRVAVSDIPDYVAGVEIPYHHQQSIPGFYGGHQPRIYSQRGIVRPGSQGTHGCYYPNRRRWTPSVHGKVAFTGDEEEPKHGKVTPVDTDNAGSSDSPTVLKIDGKLGGALEGLKT